MQNELWTALEPFFPHLENETAPMVASTSDAASLHPVDEASPNECGLIPHQNATDRDRSNLILSSWGGSLNVSSSTVRLRDYADAVCQQIIRPPKGGEFTSDMPVGASKNGDLGNIPGLAVTSSSTGMRDMIIVKAPSPGGPVQILDVPETPPPADPTTQGDRTVSGYGQGEGGPVQRPAIIRNCSEEASLQSRIVSLEKRESPFLLGDRRGQYWSEVKKTLGSASTQREYNGLLDVESRDLLIREKRDAAGSLLKEQLARRPETVDQCIDYSTDAAIRSFFDDQRKLFADSNPFPNGGRLADLAPYTKMLDSYELGLLDQLIRDVKEKGSHSRFFKELVDSYFPDGF